MYENLQYISVRDAANILKVSTKTVYKLLRQRKIGYRDFGVIEVNVNDLMQFVSDHTFRKRDTIHDEK